MFFTTKRKLVAANEQLRASFTEWAVHLDTMRDLEKTIAI